MDCMGNIPHKAIRMPYVCLQGNILEVCINVCHISGVACNLHITCAMCVIMHLEHVTKINTAKDKRIYKTFIYKKKKLIA